MSKALILGAATLVFSAASASAQVYSTPDYGYGEPVADLAVPSDGVRSPAGVHGTTDLCSPGLYGTDSRRGAASCLHSTAGGICPAGCFPAILCLRTGLLGWAWVAWLRSPVVALTPLTKMAGRC